MCGLGVLGDLLESFVAVSLQPVAAGFCRCSEDFKEHFRLGFFHLHFKMTSENKATMAARNYQKYAQDKVDKTLFDKFFMVMDKLPPANQLEKNRTYLLHLINDDNISRHFFEIIKNNDLVNVSVYGWDLSDEEYHEDIIKALKEYNIFEEDNDDELVSSLYVLKNGKVNEFTSQSKKQLEKFIKDNTAENKAIISGRDYLNYAQANVDKTLFDKLFMGIEKLPPVDQLDKNHLYFFHLINNDNISRYFFEIIKSNNELLNTSIYGWDISNEERHEDIIKVLKEYNVFEEDNDDDELVSSLYLLKNGEVKLFMSQSKRELEKFIKENTILIQPSENFIDLDINDSENKATIAARQYQKFAKANVNATLFDQIFIVKDNLPPAKELDENRSFMLHLIKDDQISHHFFEIINNNNELLNELEFSVYGWDISNREHHKDIIKVLKEYKVFEEEDDDELVSSLYLLKNGQIHSFMLQSKKHLEKFIKNCRKTPQSEIDINNDINEILFPQNFNANFNSQSANDGRPAEEKFQQQMFEQLGGEDYTVYDKGDHKYLKVKIAYSLFGVPEENKDSYDCMLEGYNKDQLKQIEGLYNIITTMNNKFSKRIDKVVMRIIFNCGVFTTEKDNKKTTSFIPFPLFIIRKCKLLRNARNNENCNIYIDYKQRVYKSWDEYLTENVLPECEMVFPNKGMYSCRSDNKVILSRIESPACGVDKKVRKGLDIAATATGLGGAAVCGVALIPAVTVAAPLLIGAGIATGIVSIYSAVTGGIDIADKIKHKEDLSLKNPEARGIYINTGLSILSLGSMGLTNIIGRLASSGRNVSTVLTGVADIASIVAVSASGGALLYNIYECIDHYIETKEIPSALHILQLSTSLLFFTNSVYNFKSTSTLVKQAQDNVINDYKKTLSRNQRRAFNKAVLETIRMNDGQASVGKAHVIRTINNFNNPKEIFATLSANRKMFNENNIKFSFSDGQLLMNGVAVDVSEFVQMSRFDRSNYMSNLPSKPMPEVPNTHRSVLTPDQQSQFSKIAGLFTFEDHQIIRVIPGMITLVNKVYNMLTQENIHWNMSQIIEIIKEFVQRFINNNPNFRVFKKTKENINDAIKFIEDHKQYFQELFTYVKRNINLIESYDVMVHAKKAGRISRDGIRRVNCQICNGYYYKNI